MLSATFGLDEKLNQNLPRYPWIARKSKKNFGQKINFREFPVSGFSADATTQNNERMLRGGKQSILYLFDKVLRLSYCQMCDKSEIKK